MSSDQDQNESVTISGADFAVMCDEIKSLSVQRDELLEALEFTADLLEARGGTALTARQAIAKAKGESCQK